MKKFVCELCQEGTLVKKDGMYVCQNCGTSYSLEDARKLLVDVPDEQPVREAPDVQQAKPAAQSEELKNLYELARRARQENNSGNGAKYYGMVLVQDPSSWEANFYSVYYTSRSCKIGEIETAGANMTNCVPSVLELVKTKEEPSVQKDAVAQITRDCCSIADLFAGAAFNTFAGISAELRPKYFGEFTGRATAGSTIMMILCETVLSKWPQEEWAYPLVNQAARKGLEICSVLRKGLQISAVWVKTDMEKSIHSIEDLFREKIQQASDKQRELQAQRRREEEQAREAYWAEHAQEKEELEKDRAKLEDERADNTRQTRELRAKLTEVPSQKKIEELQKKAEELRAQQGSLGMFKGKEKKELQLRIDQLGQDISALRPKVQEEQKPIQDQLQALRAKARQIGDEITKIDAEFRKNR